MDLSNTWEKVIKLEYGLRTTGKPLDFVPQHAKLNTRIDP